MRYEVYGIYSEDGVNFQKGVCRSMKSALSMAQLLPLTCKFFAVLVKSGRHSYPYEIISGLRGGPPTRATMLVSPNHYGNPISHEEDGKRFWKDFGGAR